MELIKAVAKYKAAVPAEQQVCAHMLWLDPSILSALHQCQDWDTVLEAYKDQIELVQSLNKC
jgi:hypothetical protein